MYTISHTWPPISTGNPFIRFFNTHMTGLRVIVTLVEDFGSKNRGDCEQEFMTFSSVSLIQYFFINYE